MNTEQITANRPTAEGGKHEFEVHTPDTTWNAVGGTYTFAYGDTRSWWAVYAIPVLATGPMLSQFPIRWKGTPS